MFSTYFRWKFLFDTRGINTLCTDDAHDLFVAADCRHKIRMIVKRKKNFNEVKRFPFSCQILHKDIYTPLEDCRDEVDILVFDYKTL